MSESLAGFSILYLPAPLRDARAVATSCAAPLSSSGASEAALCWTNHAMSCAFCRDCGPGFEDAVHRVQECLSGRGIIDAQVGMTKATPRSENSRITRGTEGF